MVQHAFMTATAAFKPTDAFVYAAALNQVEVVQKWIARQFDVNQHDSEGSTALCAAAQNQCMDVLELLLQSGARVDRQKRNGMTSLHLACKWGKLGAAERLLSLHAAVDARDDDGMTPLHYASQNGHEQLVGALLAAGADLFIANQFGATASDLASDWQRLGIFAMIAEYQATAFLSANRDRVQCVADAVGLGPAIPWDLICEYLC